MQLYMQRRPGKGRKESVGFFRSELVPTYVLRARLELTAEEKVALYQYRRLLYSTACSYYDPSSEYQVVMIMDLADNPYVDCEVIELGRIVKLEQELEAMAKDVRIHLGNILARPLDYEIVKEV